METVSNELRRLVVDRAANRCEYCRLTQSAVLHKHELDHIIPRQHGGTTDSDNLALACFRCNRHKGPNLGSFDPEGGELVSFYNPRRHQWHEHFELEGSIIVPLTAEARVTILILKLNDPDRVEERRALIDAGLYL